MQSENKHLLTILGTRKEVITFNDTDSFDELPRKILKLNSATNQLSNKGDFGYEG